MADRWFYAHDENKIGPFSGRQLRDLADSGTILSTDTIWKEGVEKGVLATRVKYLFEAIEIVVVPPTAPRVPVFSSLAAPTIPAPATLSVAVTAETPVPALVTKPIVVAPAPVEAPPPVYLPPDPLPDDIGLLPEPTDAPPAPPPEPPKKHVKKGRAVGIKGAVIVSQDGANAKYKKKCSVCSYEDSTWHSLRIAAGVVRSVFFCPKCSKKREVEIQCSLR